MINPSSKFTRRTRYIAACETVLFENKFVVWTVCERYLLYLTHYNLQCCMGRKKNKTKQNKKQKQKQTKKRCIDDRCLSTAMHGNKTAHKICWEFFKDVSLKYDKTNTLNATSGTANTHILCRHSIKILVNQSDRQIPICCTNIPWTYFFVTIWSERIIFNPLDSRKIVFLNK